MDGDVRSGAMRQFFAGVDREWSGDYLYGAKHASESGYRDHNGDLSNRHHEDGVGNDYDYRLSGGKVSVALTPAPQTSLAAGATTSLTAVVTNDSKNAGVTWTVTCRNDGMRQILADIDRERSGDYLYGAKRTSNTGYGDGNGDLGNRYDEDRIGDDYDYGGSIDLGGVEYGTPPTSLVAATTTSITRYGDERQQECGRDVDPRLVGAPPAAALRQRRRPVERQPPIPLPTILRFRLL